MSRRRRRSSSPVTWVMSRPSNRIVPSVGVSRRNTARPNVVLPDPLSPTRPSVSPVPIDSDTSSTALRNFVVRPQNPLRPTGKRIDRCSTSTSASSTARSAPLARCAGAGVDVLTPRPRRSQPTGRTRPRTAANRRHGARRSGRAARASRRGTAASRARSATRTQHPAGGTNEIRWAALDRHQPRASRRRVAACCAAAPPNTGGRVGRRGRRPAATSTIWPAYITATRSHSPATTPRSCVISSTERPRRCWISAISSRIWAWMVTSSAVVGSSAISRCGSHARAMAISTR